MTVSEEVNGDDSETKNTFRSFLVKESKKQRMSKMKLEKEYTFEVSEKNKVGHMRCDFVSGKLANKWFPTSLCTDEQNLIEVQAVVNKIMDEINDFEKIVAICEGEGYDKYANLYVYEGDYNYWVRLNPVCNDYSMYIHVYLQEN